MDPTEQINTTPFLTQDEHSAVYLLGKAAETIRRIIGEGSQSSHDWAEAASYIHILQRMVLAQAATRAYPDLYRALGETLKGDKQ